MERILDVKPYIARAPQQHAIFGSKIAKNHMFSDPKWKSASRLEQFRFVCEALKKHQQFQKLESNVRKHKKKKLLQRLKNDCNSGRSKLNIFLHGSISGARTLLKNDKTMLRLYAKMPVQMILEDLNCRTFSKRKEFDRLHHKKEVFMKKYEEKLIELANLQDQITSKEEQILNDESKGNDIIKEIQSSGTRLKTFKTITRAYKKISAALVNDSTYYEQVLNSLQTDIYDQTALINEISNLGIPAIRRVNSLSSEYKNLLDDTRKFTNLKIKNITDCKTKVMSQNEEIKNFIRKDNDFQTFLHRYDRETRSMMDLKNQLEDIEKIMKEVKQVTLSNLTRDINPRIEKQIENVAQFENHISNQKKKLECLRKENEAAIITKELLKHNFTDNDIEYQNKLQDLKEEIIQEKKRQNECEVFIQERGKMMRVLRFSLQNLANVLRHVGDPVPISRKPYTDPDMKLPLLKFDAFPPKAFPMLPFQGDADKLVKALKEKVTELMAVYVEEQTIQDLEEADKHVHNTYMQRFIKNNQEHHEEIDKDNLSEAEISYATVPNRMQIKSMSAKIVEAHSKMDD